MIEEEIISVQIGKFSNLIGATIWNLREEFLSDEGNCNEKFLSATYYHTTTRRPRCVALDLMENCCNRRQVVSEDASVDSQTWSGKVRKHSGVAYSFNNHSDNDSWVELLKVNM